MNQIEATRSPSHSSRWLVFFLIFVASSVLLFFGMQTVPSTYDEGISLTAAMRIAEAGQVPHRDFYAIYGPAQFYSLAWLFKLFGESLFVERLLYTLITGLIVSAVYYITSEYCGRFVTVWTTVTIALWLFG